MTSDIQRRSLLRGSLVLEPRAFSLPAQHPRPKPGRPRHRRCRPRRPRASPTREASSGRPAVARSYGPNGTHFPDDLPWMGEAAPLELIAECSWADIESAVRGLDAATVAEGVVIRVKPGTLTGNGSGSSSQPVLASVGDPVVDSERAHLSPRGLQQRHPGRDRRAAGPVRPAVAVRTGQPRNPRDDCSVPRCRSGGVGSTV